MTSSEEKSAAEQLQEMIDQMTEDDNFLFIVQSDKDEDAAKYKAFSTGDYSTTVNAAVVALTLAGKEIIANVDGDDPDAPGMDARAFLYGMKVLSQTAEEWSNNIKDMYQAEEGPKHVKETVEDSAGSKEGGDLPRVAKDGSSIH